MANRESIVILDQASGYLQLDMLNVFKERYNKCAIIAGTIVERNKKLDSNIKWSKVIPYDRSSPFKRIITWGLCTIQMFFLLITKYRKFHAFIITNPPTAIFLPLFVRNNYSILVYDVYPDALVEYNYIKKGRWIDKLWSKVNKKVFQKAEAVYTISEGMKKRVSKYMNSDKIQIVPIWTDNDFLRPIPKKENEFRKKLGYQDQFLVMYSGNLGRSHDIEVLVELAKTTQAHPIYYLIIGGGDKYKKIEESIKQSGLSNIKIMPWQPVEILPLTMAAADLAVVSLGKEASLLSVPSKTYNFMSVAAPLLCIASPESELSLLVNKYGIGKCFDSEDLEKMKEYVLTLYNNPTIHQQMSENALNATADFTPENAKLFV